MKRRLLSIAWISLCVTGASPADPAPPPPAAEEQVDVRLLELSALVLDAEGAPVADLGPGDLRVALGATVWKPLYVEPEAAPRGDPPRVRVSLEHGPPSEASATEPMHWIFFLDLENDPPARQNRVIEAFDAFVRDHLPPADLAAVVSLAGTLRMEAPFTTDREALAQAVRRAFGRGRTVSLSTRQRVDRLALRMDQCEYITDNPLILGEDRRDTPSFETGNRVAEANCIRGVADTYRAEQAERGGRFLRSLLGAMRLAGSLRQRVRLVACTHGVSMDPESELREVFRSTFGTSQMHKLNSAAPGESALEVALERIVQAARAEGVTLHFLDLARAPAGGRTARTRRIQSGSRSPLEVAFRASRGPLERLAEGGGGVLAVEADPLEGLRRVMDLERARLRLGISLDAPLDEDALRKLKVEATRPGLRVRFTPVRQLRPVPWSLEDFRFRLGDPVPLEADEGEGVFLPFQLRVRQRVLGYESRDGAWSASLTVHVRVAQVDGRTLAESFQYLRHAVPAGDAAPRLEGWLAFRGWLEAPPGAYRLEAHVRNVRTGAEVATFEELKVPAALERASQDAAKP